METSKKHSRATIILCEIAIKSFLLSSVFILYIGIVWLGSEKSLFENAVGFFAALLCTILVFVPIMHKLFMRMFLLSLLLFGAAVAMELY